MQAYSRGKIGIISCSGGLHFAKKVVVHLRKILSEEKDPEQNIFLHSTESWFSNGEVKTEIGESARNEDVYIIQDVANSTLKNNNNKLGINDHFMALKTAIDSAKRADVHHITAVLPYYPFSRQDRKKSREGITAKQVARELELAGAKRVIALDIHNESTEGFFESASFENLRASKCVIPHIKETIKSDNLIVVAPDVGSVGRNEFFAKHLGTELGIVYKKRDYSTVNKIDSLKLLGDVNGKDVLMVDDMIDTAGTILEVAKLIKSQGAKDIYLSASLPLFSGPALERINAAHKQGLIKKVIGTDAIYHGDDFVKGHPWYEEVSVAGLFAEAIYNINRGKSIRSLLES